MRLLCFQAKRFSWRSAARAGDEVGGAPREAAAEDGERRECVVVFAHVEQADETDAARARALRHALKHVKWLCNKRAIERVVLHSFTHLGAVSAAPAAARALLDALAERLRDAGYEACCTPFGRSCEWSLDVHGESLAKVYKQL